MILLPRPVYLTKALTPLALLLDNWKDSCWNMFCRHPGMGRSAKFGKCPYLSYFDPRMASLINVSDQHLWDGLTNWLAILFFKNPGHGRHWISWCVQIVAPIPKNPRSKKIHLSCVSCHVSHVICHLSHVLCHMSPGCYESPRRFRDAAARGLVIDREEDFLFTS